MTETTPPADDLLRRTESYLSALHGSVARHDNLAANYGCAGCELRDQIAAALRAATIPAAALSDAEQTMLAYALDQAQERIWVEGGFTEEDQAAVDSLRRRTVLPAPADRAAILMWAADQIDAETQQAKSDGVLEPDKFRPCRDASAQLRALAGCQECEWGVEHTEHCPYPESHNWGCGCPTDQFASGPGRAAGETQHPECACDPAPHREEDGTYSHWAGCPIADAQQAAHGGLLGRRLRLTDDQDGCYIPTATIKRPPMDPVHILGIGSDEDCSALRAALLARQRPPAETQQATSCSQPNACGEDGEPCDAHERQQAHAEGEHCFCGPECTAVSQPAKEA